MSDYTIMGLSKKMREIDIVMFFTRSEGGELAGRPMSNNGEVDYDGESYFFSYDTTRTVQDIGRDPNVALSCQFPASAPGAAPLFVAIQGDASLIHDPFIFAAVWSKHLERWFPEGVNTPGLVLIRVRATRVHYWEGADEGEILVEV